MEASMPVTEVERELEGEGPLVFRTDLCGMITYADSRFLKASGYCAGQLYGKSHHIVRHPDMPSTVFMDMWGTVSNGEPWTGIIKSRRRDGSFYWAHTTATPVSAGGRITGCMLVYRKPTPSQIGEASRLYQRMNGGVGAASSLIGAAAGFPWQKNRAISLRLVSGLVFMAVLLICAGVASQLVSGVHNIFLVFAIAGLALAAWAAFLLARAKARLLDAAANSAAATAFAGLNSKMAGTYGKEEGGLPRLQKGTDFNQNRLQRKGEPGFGKITVGENGRGRQLARNTSDIAITRARKTTAGAALGGEAGKTVEGIVVAVKRVAGIMAEISAVPAGQHMAAGQGTVMKEKTVAAAGFAPAKSDKLAGSHKNSASAKKKAVSSRPLRPLKGGEDEWKDF